MRRPWPQLLATLVFAAGTLAGADRAAGRSRSYARAAAASAAAEGAGDRRSPLPPARQQLDGETAHPEEPLVASGPRRGPGPGAGGGGPQRLRPGGEGEALRPAARPALPPPAPRPDRGGASAGGGTERSRLLDVDLERSRLPVGASRGFSIVAEGVGALHALGSAQPSGPRKEPKPLHAEPLHAEPKRTVAEELRIREPRPPEFLMLPKVVWALIADVVAMICFVLCIPWILSLAKRRRAPAAATNQPGSPT